MSVVSPRTALRLFTLSLTLTLPLVAQKRGKARAAARPAVVSAPTLAGIWSGTATVPLGDSTIVVPVTYTFVESGATIAGTAMVPGQGTGPIANVTRDGMRLRFRVTAPEAKLLEHDGNFGADGAIEGMVNLDGKPVAKFRITPRRAAPPAK